MIKYVKLKENGTLEYAPRNIQGVSNWINDEAAVLEVGYLPLEEIETPERQYIASYTVDGDKIIPVFASLPEPTYQEQRRAAYPPIEEQLDMLYWDKVEGTNIWQETISAIKAKYPKPEYVTEPIEAEEESGEEI